ncbi:MAG: hypothetical protein KUL75_06095 [Sterolibacterium sp.]|nr:hypothetical protein [Sterolibacterium sp.]
MKRARKSRRKAVIALKSAASIKPRNPYVVAALQRKGGAHQRQDKRSGRAQQSSQWRREFSED